MKVTKKVAATIWFIFWAVVLLLDLYALGVAILLWFYVVRL